MNFLIKIVPTLFTTLQEGLVPFETKLIKPLLLGLETDEENIIKDLKSCYTQILNALSQHRQLPKKQFVEIYEKLSEKLFFSLIQRDKNCGYSIESII